MALILSIETADKGCSVALHQGGVLIDCKTETDTKSSSSLLTTLISEVLISSNKEFEDLEAVAVSEGPGSYTGLRIGVSTAKGLCYALDLPLIAVNTLDGIIHANREVKFDTICPMLDARRMEVYCKVKDIKTAEVILKTSAMVIDKDSFSDVLNHKTVFFCGPGAGKCQEFLSGNENAFFEKQTTQVQAMNMGELAFEAFTKGSFEELAIFEPYYLKDFLVKKSQKKMPLDNSK